MSIQYIHQAVYGNIGNHSLEPQYMVKGNEVYATQYNKDMPHDKPLYHVRDGKWYQSQFHPGGQSAHAFYETKGDRIHTTLLHPEHNPLQHVFEMRSHLAR
jgi:hypothetical protein